MAFGALTRRPTSEPSIPMAFIYSSTDRKKSIFPQKFTNLTVQALRSPSRAVPAIVCLAIRVLIFCPKSSFVCTRHRQWQSGGEGAKPTQPKMKREASLCKWRGFEAQRKKDEKEYKKKALAMQFLFYTSKTENALSLDFIIVCRVRSQKRVPLFYIRVYHQYILQLVYIFPFPN